MGESVDSGARPRQGHSPDESSIRPAACPRPGRYRHYKGSDYRVIDCVRHSETEEWLVLYRALYGERGLWVRPLAMFAGTVEHDGRERARFAFVDGGVEDDGVEDGDASGRGSGT